MPRRAHPCTTLIAIAQYCIDVAIYDDRLEVVSTGGLHFGITVAQLKGEHQSRLWNPLVAQAFYMRGIIERWGRGTNRIVEQTLEAGLAEPEMFDSRLAFTMRFNASRPIISPPGLSTIQEDILRSLHNIGPVPFGQLVKELSGSYSEDQIQRALQHLRKRNLAERSGATRSSVWSATAFDRTQ